MQDIPEFGYLRVAQVLAVFPVSRTTWLDGVRAGRFPKPVKITEGCSAWKVEDIRALIETLNNGEPQE